MVRVAIVARSAEVRTRLADRVGADPGLIVAVALAPRPGCVDRLACGELDMVIVDAADSDGASLDAVREARTRLPETPMVVLLPAVDLGARVLSIARSSHVAGCLRRPDGAEALERLIADRLLPLVRAVVRSRARARSASQPIPRARSAVPGGREDTPLPLNGDRHDGPVEALVIGCSTGGPNALTAVLPALPGDLGVPVLVVQHMPPRFTSLLADRLDQLCALRVSEGRDGEAVEAGRIYLAPGGLHMRVEGPPGRARLVLGGEDPVNGCRPSVDVLFESAVRLWGGALCSAILTGMGSDGLDGSRRVVEAGGVLIAQDRETSVVWGMPKSVVEAGLTTTVLPLNRIGSSLVRQIRLGRAPVRAAS